MNCWSKVKAYHYDNECNTIFQISMTFYGLFYVFPLFIPFPPPPCALVYIRQITNKIVNSKSIVYDSSVGPASPGAIWHWGDLTLLSSWWLLFFFHSSRRKMVPLKVFARKGSADSFRHFFPFFCSKGKRTSSSNYILIF